MDTGNILGILGLIATIILGIYGIYYTKHHKSISNVSLICHSIIPIFSTLQKKFDKIKIQYSDKPISENLVFCKFSLINTGVYDIDKEIVYKPLEIEFPSDHNILDCSISNKSTDDINVNVNVNKNVAIINWDLLKINEFISLDMFVDIPKGEEEITVYNYIKKLKLHYRIANLNSIELIDYQEIEPNKKSSSIFKTLSFYLLLLSVTSLFSFGLFQGIKSFFSPGVVVNHNIIHKPTGKTVENITFKDNILILRNQEIIDTIELKNFNDYILLNPKLTIKSNDYFMTVVALIATIFMIFLFFTFIKESINDYKVNKILRRIKK